MSLSLSLSLASRARLFIGVVCGGERGPPKRSDWVNVWRVVRRRLRRFRNGVVIKIKLFTDDPFFFTVPLASSRPRVVPPPDALSHSVERRIRDSCHVVPVIFPMLEFTSVTTAQVQQLSRKSCAATTCEEPFRFLCVAR